ncbi:MAG: hypothetical protein RLN62_04090 [Rickettsiales bacterium]
MPSFTTSPLYLGPKFADSLTNIRDEINSERLKQSIDQIFVPVELNGGTICLVLNNAVDENTGKFPNNLYIEAVLDENGEEIYNQADYKEGFIAYPGILPEVNFFCLNYSAVTNQLEKDYTLTTRPMVIQLAMLVEAIRFHDVGAAIAEALENDGVVAFENFHEQITSWCKSSQAYCNYVEEVLKESITEAEQQEFINLQNGIEESLIQQREVHAPEAQEPQGFFDVAALDSYSLFMLAGFLYEYSGPSL